MSAAGDVDVQASVVRDIAERLAGGEWPEMQQVLERAASQPQRDWLLPERVCRAVGGASEQARPGMAALACLQISLILIDDVLDDDPRGEHRRLGAGEAANLAAVFQALGLAAIVSSTLDPACKLEVLRGLSEMPSRVALGQHLDARGLADEAHYWRVAELKSGAFFAAAWEMGALLGGASAAKANRLGQVGRWYGEMIQIHDDLSDSLAVPAGPDWAPGRFTLPILFAHIVPHPERERFRELRPHVAEPAALSQAQDILVRCGAISYGLHELPARHQRAQTLLKTIPLAEPEVVQSLFEDLLRPVQALLEMVR